MVPGCAGSRDKPGMTGTRRELIILYIGARPVPVAMNILGFLLSCRIKFPNTHLMRISAPVSIFRSICEPRPSSSSLMRKVNRCTSCLTIEYDRVNSHSLSLQRKLTNCPNLLVKSSSVSITSSIVVGLSNVLSTTIAA